MSPYQLGAPSQDSRIHKSCEVNRFLKSQSTILFDDTNPEAELAEPFENLIRTQVSRRHRERMEFHDDAMCPRQSFLRTLMAPELSRSWHELFLSLLLALENKLAR